MAVTVAVSVSCLTFSACASASSDKSPGSAAPASIAGKVDFKAELSSPQSADGSILVITITVPPELRNETVIGEFEGAELPFFASPDLGEGIYETVLGVPYGHKPGASEVTIKAGSSANPISVNVPVKIVEGDYKSETIKTDQRHVTPTSKKDLKRIRREVEEVAKIYAHLTLHKYWKGPFVLPMDSMITSPFGTKRVYNGEVKHFHPGADFRAKIGTPIHADAPGIVVLAKNLFFTGNTVMIDHGYGVVTLFAHMSKLKVKKGQLVSAKTVLGLSGKTGRVTGPHLHWQCVIRKQKVNPLDLTRVMR